MVTLTLSQTTLKRGAVTTQLLKKVTVITVITVTGNVTVFWTPKIRLLLLSNWQPRSVVSEKDDTEMLAKKAKIDGMRSVINLKKIEAINTQIAVMERLENVYVARMGRDAYEHKLVTLANKLPDMLEEEEEQPRDLDGADLY